MPHQLEQKRAIKEIEQKRIVSEQHYKCKNCGVERDSPEGFLHVECTDTRNWVVE